MATRKESTAPVAKTDIDKMVDNLVVERDEAAAYQTRVSHRLASSSNWAYGHIMYAVEHMEEPTSPDTKAAVRVLSSLLLDIQEWRKAKDKHSDICGRIATLLDAQAGNRRFRGEK